MYESLASCIFLFFVFCFLFVQGKGLLVDKKADEVALVSLDRPALGWCRFHRRGLNGGEQPLVERLFRCCCCLSLLRSFPRLSSRLAPDLDVAPA